MCSFQPFGALHLRILLLTALAAWGLIRLARRRPAWRDPLARTLAIALLVNELAYWAYQTLRGAWTFPRDLPLQICDLAVFLVAWALWRPRRRHVAEVAYFWGAAATMQALLTPDLPAQVPWYICVKFFLTHGGIVVSVAFLAGALGWRPGPYAPWRMLFVTDLYAVAIGAFNAAFDKNYLYLCAKPARASLLDWLGPWPWYILSLQVVALALFWACALPLRLRPPRRSATKNAMYNASPLG